MDYKLTGRYDHKEKVAFWSKPVVVLVVEVEYNDTSRPHSTMVRTWKEASSHDLFRLRAEGHIT